MQPSSAGDAVTAATRFGFGARPGELDAIARDPRGWVLGQLGRAPTPLGGNLPDSASMVVAELEMRRDKRLGDEAGKRAFNERVRAVYLAEVGARLGAAVASETPLVERLTYFWSNHFTVSILRPAIRGFAAAFEREAIRPHVTGRFSDMLLAVARHPAMLLYLDNAISVGPESRVGLRGGKGLNENLGRELLELHTLGVDGGYTQADVESLARILTGWSVARLNEPDSGRFRFRPIVHQPGAKLLLGRTYAEAGEAEGQAALLDLAHHPATARHVATKLARHFIADDPPKESVERIARVFRDSGGDLRRVTAAVVKEDAAWRRPFAKMRTPQELLIGACRSGGFTPPPEMVVNSLRTLDQMPFFAPSPAGWPDTAASWVSPEAVLRRAQWCEAYAERMPDPPDPVVLAQAALGDALPEETAQAIRRAPSRRVGLALLFASPEFQRR
ncbi:MAG TPA: DUF1800 domain-containing protein [Stellaceae bacterium]|nr:DUF1800 domain-containing protein [Stellaceae bacterium]